MGEQNRRAVEVEPSPVDTKPSGPGAATRPQAGDDPTRALGPRADERQTARQAPAGAAPGESAENDSIG